MLPHHHTTTPPHRLTTSPPHLPWHVRSDHLTDVLPPRHTPRGRYNQHSEDVLDLTKSPLDFFRDLFPDGLVTAEGIKKLTVEEWRNKLGVFGLADSHQTLPMRTMSPGFRARCVFCLMSLRNPHLLLLGKH